MMRGAKIVLVASFVVFCVVLYYVYGGSNKETSIGASRLYIKRSNIAKQTSTVDRNTNKRASKKSYYTKCVNYRSYTKSLRFKSSIKTKKMMFSTVKRLLFFIGHEMSGSLLARLLDAHPHISLPHEYDVFSHWLSEPKLRDKSHLFPALYKASVKNEFKVTKVVKKYGVRQLCSTAFVTVPKQWQGKCDRYLEIIGDASAGKTAIALESHPSVLNDMESKLKLPKVFIYPISHPLDMLAMQVLQASATYTKYRHTNKQYNNTELLQQHVQMFEKRVGLIHQWMESQWINVLPVYNDEMVNSPKTVLKKVCSFLQISCLVDYIDSCSDVVFSDTSKIRDNIYWPSVLKQQVLVIVRKYKLFERYESDF